uniref:Uncharacterized protein n=3 Tax=Lygus hesperus TaxID=30085 RepID=A0A0K8SQK3_LYGHE
MLITRKKIIMRTNVGNFEIAQNNMIDLQQSASVKQPVVEEPKSSDELAGTEIGTQTVPHHICGNRSLLARPTDGPYSFKQLIPLFHSKADDQTVADVLLSAMNEDKETLPGKVSVRQQTGESQTSSDDEILDRVESSCNTDQPYLSESIQTRESFLDSQPPEPGEIPRITVDKSEQCDEASIDHVPTEILQTENKECNTDAFSVSAIVQTKETFHDDEKSFVESEKDEVTVISQLSKDKGTDVFVEEVEAKSADKSCNTANPLTTSSVQTDNLNTVNEVKPLVVSQAKSVGKKKDVQFVDSGVQQTSRQNKKGVGISRQKRDTPTPYCTRSNPDDSSQVLELNVPPCSCHMCTFHKRSQAATDKKELSGVRGKIGPKRSSDSGKDSKKLQKFPTGRRSVGKFQRKFEVIPEEKGSMESIADETTESKPTPSTEWSKTLVTTGTMTRDPGRHVSIQEPPLPEEKVDDTTQTCAFQEEEVIQKVIQVNTKKSNLVIGRFRAIPDDLQDEGSSSDLGNLPDGLEVVRQYKGRAALAAGNVSGQEELLTLSKGWINFYLLKDNQDLDDATNEGFQIEGTNIDESVQEYTLEIQATPEQDFTPEPSTRHGRGSSILPNLPQRELKRSRQPKAHQSSRPGAGQVTLPDIHSSSSSSTPENQDGHHPHSTRKHHRHALPDVNDARGSRHEIKSRRERREQVTAIAKTEPIFKLPTEMDHNLETSHSTKAVEVARSEHSVSSITSSTVIVSESPSPQQMHFSDRKVQKRSAMYSETNGVGSSWTVTVAGSSGVTNQTPPDVEMRLTFAKPNGRPGGDGQERSLMQYNGVSQQTHHISRSKRKNDRRIQTFTPQREALAAVRT